MRIRIESKYFFFIAYILYLICAFYTKTAFYVVESKDIEYFLKILRYLSYILLIIYGFYEKHNHRSLILICALLAVLIFTSFASNRVLVFSVVFAYIAKDIDYRSIIKCSLYFMVCLWIILIVAMVIGTIDNILIYTSDFVGGRYRYCLGFKHPNNATQYFLLTMIQFFWLKKDKIKLRYFIESIILTILMYFWAKSRAGIVISIGFLIALIFRKYLLAYLNKFKLIETLICYFVPVLAIFNIIMSLMYATGHFKMINIILNGRVALASKMILTMGIKLWGQTIEWNYTMGMYNIVDSSYIRDLIEYGILGYTVIMFGYTLIMKYAIKEKDIVLIITIVLISLYAMSENILMSFPINPFIVMFSTCFRSEKGRKNYEKYN